MPRPKKETAQVAAPAKLSFLVKKTRVPEKQVQVSARIDESLKIAFEKASTAAEKNGMELSIQHIFEVALRNAITEVEEAFNVSCFQTEMDV